jgi:hypothetical protein
LNRRQLIIEPEFLQVCQFDAFDVTEPDPPVTKTLPHQLLSGGDARKTYTSLTATKKSRRKNAGNRKQFARATMSRHSLTSVNSL